VQYRTLNCARLRSELVLKAPKKKRCFASSPQGCHARKTFIMDGIDGTDHFTGGVEGMIKYIPYQSDIFLT